MSSSRNILLAFIFTYQVHSGLSYLKCCDSNTTYTYFNLSLYAYSEAKVVVTSDVYIIGNLELNLNPAFAYSINFDKLMVHKSGSAYITVTGTTSGTKINSFVYFEESKENIEIILPSDIVPKNKWINIKIRLVNQYDILLMKNSTLEISDGIKDHLVSTTNGLYEFYQIYPQNGYYDIYVETFDGNYASKEFYVGYIMSISIDSQKIVNSYTQQQVSINFDTYYYQLGYLYLDCIDQCSESNFKQSGNNEKVEYIVFNINEKRHSFDVFILSSGIFSWRATSMNFENAETGNFTVKNPDIFIYSYFDKNITSPYLPFNYKIEVYDKDNEFYPDQISVTIKDSNDASSIMNEEIDIQSGQKTLEIYYKVVVESAFLTAICNEFTDVKSDSNVIQVYPNRIEMYFEQEWIPNLPNENFKFIVRVKDLNWNTESTHGVYKIEIYLQPSSSNLGGSQTSITTAYGVKIIDDLYVKSSGNHKFLITCDVCEDYYSDWFEISSDKCEFSAITLICLGTLLIVSILCATAFFILDKNVEEAKYLDHPYRILIFHPLMSLVLRQPRNIRLINSLQLFTSEINLLMAIGVMYFYYDTPTKVDDEDFSDFDSDQAAIGATGWGFSIFSSIIMFIFKMYSIVTPDSKRYYYIVCPVLTLLACAAIIYMSLNYCKSSIESWAKNFYIFFVIDIILIQYCLSILAIYFTKLDLKIPQQVIIEIEIDKVGIYRIDENNNPFVETPGNN